MANKITKREVINAMLADVAINGNETYVAYLKNELALIEKKAANKKSTKTQEENKGIKSVILNTLASIGSGTITDIQNANSDLAELSNQKVSALVRQLVATGEVVKTTDKKKSIFSLATVDEVGAVGLAAGCLGVDRGLSLSVVWRITRHLKPVKGFLHG